ncbi:MAG: hypothetical protein JWL73_1121 [Actinomycetia bacterium]|nr:hypothetical protein [Actinomycetes bacterium]
MTFAASNGTDVVAGDLADAVAAASLTLARAFAAGATLWCVAPEWPAHAEHVAVEFVHPVIVGTRAFPAIPVGAADPVAGVRVLARPGDVVIVIGTTRATGIRPLLRRAGAWGLTSIWLGTGPRPEAAWADHLIWLQGPDAHGPGPGVPGEAVDFVLAYHLLWELTQVVFEHPGLLTAPVDEPAGEVCITCSDEGRLAEVEAVTDDAHADVLAGGRRESIDVRLVDPVEPGDLVLVHAGVAIAVVDGAEP